MGDGGGSGGPGGGIGIGPGDLDGFGGVVGVGPGEPGGAGNIGGIGPQGMDGSMGPGVDAAMGGGPDAGGPADRRERIRNIFDKKDKKVPQRVGFVLDPQIVANDLANTMWGQPTMMPQMNPMNLYGQQQMNPMSMYGGPFAPFDWNAYLGGFK